MPLGRSRRPFVSILSTYLPITYLQCGMVRAGSALSTVLSIVHTYVLVTLEANHFRPSVQIFFQECAYRTERNALKNEDQAQNKTNPFQRTYVPSTLFVQSTVIPRLLSGLRESFEIMTCSRMLSLRTECNKEPKEDGPPGKYHHN
jgi:hypothetical protein